VGDGDEAGPLQGDAALPDYHGRREPGPPASGMDIVILKYLSCVVLDFDITGCDRLIFVRFRRMFL
jgi:hypothetical protein